MGFRESDRITAGLRYVAGELSVHRDEFRREHAPGGSALLDGCESLGYVKRGEGEAGDRYAMTAAGLRRLAAVDPAAAEG
jgi:hypothetical protein